MDKSLAIREGPARTLVTLPSHPVMLLTYNLLITFVVAGLCAERFRTH